MHRRLDVGLIPPAGSVRLMLDPAIRRRSIEGAAVIFIVVRFAVKSEWRTLLDLDPSKVNVNGGAIAIGHPIGMSGARIALRLALELNRRGGGVGAAALCDGGGQGSALILRVPA